MTPRKHHQLQAAFFTRKWLVTSFGVIILFSLGMFWFRVSKVTLGNYFFDDGVFYAPKIATALYKAALVFDSENTVPPLYANYQLGRIHFLKGEYDTALDYFEREKAAHPENHKVYYIMGLTYGYDGRYHKAIESFDTYNKLEPNSWAGKNDEAWLYFKIGDLASARALVEGEYQAGRYNPWILTTFGVILLNQNECDAAAYILSLAYDKSLTLTNTSWGRAYPGNNPKDYAKGLHEMRETIEKDLDMAKECSQKSKLVEKK